MTERTMGRLGWFFLVLAFITLEAVSRMHLPIWKQYIISAAPFLAAQVLLAWPVFKNIVNNKINKTEK